MSKRYSKKFLKDKSVEELEQIKKELLESKSNIELEQVIKQEGGTIPPTSIDTRQFRKSPPSLIKKKHSII